MEEAENKDRDREEIFSRIVRAGKRTYFFDVKATVAEERYLTITESKRRFSNDDGKFFYEKHKLFLYKEDFEKFMNGLSDAVEFIKTGKAPYRPEAESDDVNNKPVGKVRTDLTFEDLETDNDTK